MRLQLSTLLAIASVALCPGCGTLGHQIGGPAEVYGGVHEDCKAIGRGDVWLILDLPFSLVGDTLFISADLPLTDPVKGWTVIADYGACVNAPEYDNASDCLKKMPAPIAKDIKGFIDTLAGGDLNEVAYFESKDGRHGVRVTQQYSSSSYVDYYVLYTPSNARTKVVKVERRSYFHGFGNIDCHLYETLG